MNDPAVLTHYYEKQDAMTRECLLALKSIIMSVDEHIEHVRKYQIPFFTYKGFNLGFLWVHRKKIVVGFVEDKKLLPDSSVSRKKDKMTTMEINPMQDIPMDSMLSSYKELIRKYDQYAQ